MREQESSRESRRAAEREEETVFRGGGSGAAAAAAGRPDELAGEFMGETAAVFCQNAEPIEPTRVTRCFACA